MDAANSAIAYKRQQILTASPAQLTLMLYNGAIRFIHESMQAIDNKDMEKAHIANMRAQDIVREFMSTLDMNYEISQNWYQLYEFIHHSLVEGNMKKDRKPLEAAAELLLEMREAWVGAMKETNAIQSVLPAAVNK